MEFPDHGANPTNLYSKALIEMPQAYIDFSTNTNILESAVDTCLNQEMIAKYPDPECKELINILCDKIGYKHDEVLITNGANEAIYIIASLAVGKTVAIMQPTYPEYKKALDAYDVTVINVNTIEQANDVDADIMFICNPNNPTGELLDLNTVGLFKGQIVIDESYIDFVDDDCLGSVKKSWYYDNLERLIVLRSFTKIYSMAGLRGGYVISSPLTISTIKRRQPTWSVNSVTQAHLINLINNDDALIQKTKTYIKNEKKYMVDHIEKMGYEVRNSSVNFFLIEVEDDTNIITFLLQKGIIVRHTRNHIGLDGRYIRVSVKKRHQNNKLISALQEYKCN